MKTIILDIETAPSMAYVWSFWKQNISDDMTVDYGGYIMSCAIKELGKQDIVYLENRTDNDSKITKDILTYLDDADFVVAHNGKRFDIPFIKARAAIHNLKPPSPFKVIDTLVIAKKEMSFKRNTLAHLCDILDVSIQKSSHAKYPGFKLWLGCLNQEEEAWKEMKQYNILDIESLEQVYLRLRPWYTTHPNVNTGDEHNDMCCPKCGSIDLIKSGFYTTNKGKYQRYACKSCGAWSSETYVINTIEKRKSLLASR